MTLQLRDRWADGTTHLVFDPVGLLGPLAVLVPRPRINPVLYHGVLGPRAAWRADIVGARRQQGIAMSPWPRPLARWLTTLTHMRVDEVPVSKMSPRPGRIHEDSSGRAQTNLAG